VRVRLRAWPGRSKGVVWNETGAERTVCGLIWSSGGGSIQGTGVHVRLRAWPGRSKDIFGNETGAERTVCGLIWSSG